MAAAVRTRGGPFRGCSSQWSSEFDVPSTRQQRRSFAAVLEVDEAPDDGVLREAQEETGLNSLEIRRFLGTREYDMSSFGRAEIHRRCYFYLECKEKTPSTWRHFETHPSEGLSKEIEFELFWVRLADQVPELSAAQGDLLADLDVCPNSIQ